MDKFKFSPVESPNNSSVLNPQFSAAEACCDVDHGQHEVFVEQTESWDRWGMLLSSLCAIHCLLTPILLLSLPAMGTYFESRWVHLGMALFVVPVGFYAFWSGYRHHRKLPLMLLGFTGLALVAAASLLPEVAAHAHTHENESFGEIIRADIVTIVGSMLLICGHFFNRRACLCHKHS